MAVDHKESGNTVCYLQTIEAGGFGLVFFATLVAQAHPIQLKRKGKVCTAETFSLQQVLQINSLTISLYLQNRSLVVFILFIGTSLLQASC